MDLDNVDYFADTPILVVNKGDQEIDAIIAWVKVCITFIIIWT